VGPRAYLDDVEKRKLLTLSGLQLRLLGHQPIASCYTDCAIPVHVKEGYITKLGRKEGTLNEAAIVYKRAINLFSQIK
jgi:hypothetical protein